MEIGDRDTMGSKVMTLKPFLYQENYIVVVNVCILSLYFLFKRVFIIHKAYKIFQEYINSLSVHLAVCQLVDLSLH